MFINSAHGETLKDDIAEVMKRFAADQMERLVYSVKNIVIHVTNMETLLTFTNRAHGETLKNNIADAMKRFAVDQIGQLVDSVKTL
jgi:septation ring formation regulator EzrA